MGLPAGSNTHYYQGIIIAEVALTLFFFIVLQILYYAKWGYAEEDPSKADKKQGQAQQSRFDKFKWDQKSWNIYFPIIFANHLVALSLPLIYAPFIFTIIIGFIHFGCFIALLIFNIFIKDSQQNQGSGIRTWGSRIIWIAMCIQNIILMITGLSGIASVVVSV